MKRNWTTDELIDEWTLGPSELRLVGKKAGAGRIGFAVLLAFFLHEGRFPKQHEVPSAVVAHIAKQVAVEPRALLLYAWSGRTIELHRARIRRALSYREMTVEDASFLTVWLVNRVLPREHREPRILEAAFVECRSRHLEPPSADRLNRLVHSAMRSFEEHLNEQTVARLSPPVRASLHRLIDLDGPFRSPTDDNLEDLRKDQHTDDESLHEPSAPGSETDPSWDVEALLSDIEADATQSSTPAIEAMTAPPSTRPVQQASPETRGAPGVKAPEEMTLVDLRADPGATGLDSILTEVNKLRRLRQLELPETLFAELSPQVIQAFRDRAAVEAPSLLRRHPEPIGLTLLAALCWSRVREVTDGLVTLFIAVIQRMGRQAERKVEREVIEEYRKVAGKSGILFRVAEAAIAHPDGLVREVIYPAAGGERLLTELVKEYRASGPQYREHIQLVMKRSFSTYYRRMLPPLLDVLDFRSNNEVYQPLIRALALIRSYARSGATYYPLDEPVPLEGIVRPMWRDLVIEDGPAGELRSCGCTTSYAPSRH